MVVFSLHLAEPVSDYPMRIVVLSEHRESKDLSLPALPPVFHIFFRLPYPATPVFATLTKTAGCVPTIPKLKLPDLDRKDLP